MVSKFPDIASRLAHIMASCGYPKDAPFAAALGLPAQNLGNWRKRNSIGKESMALIRDVTGASMDWIDSGEGEPFPAGPIPYAGAPLSGPDAAKRLEAVERDIKDLVTAFAVSLMRFSATTPAAAEGVAADLRKHLSRPGRPSAVLPELLRAVESALPQASPVAPRKKPRSSR
jgi:hypothetical protein